MSTNSSDKVRSLHHFKSLTLATVFGMAFTAQVATAKNNPSPKMKVDAPNVYNVKKGDTLWNISSKYLKQPWRWKDIWATNKQIVNPHKIWPGDKLILCIIQGKRMVGIDNGEGCSGLEKAITGKATKPIDRSSSSNRIRYEELSSAIPILPLNVIRPWLHNAQVVDPDALKDTPYVIASKNKNIITAVGDKIYVRGQGLEIGKEYGVYRVGKSYNNPGNGRSLGQEVFQIAKGIVTNVENNAVSSLELRETFRSEVREGDKVFISLDNTLQPLYTPIAGSLLRKANIIRTHGTISSAPKNTVVTVNVGQQHGAKSGQVFSIYRKGALIRDENASGEHVRMPSERSGTLMLFKTFDHVSYAFVLDSDSHTAVGDELRSPEDFGE